LRGGSVEQSILLENLEIPAWVCVKEEAVLLLVRVGPIGETTWKECEEVMSDAIM